MSFTVKTENKNYLAKIISLPKPRPHPNATKLQCVTIDGNNVITGMDAKEGQTYVYFPLESAINKEYLSYSNSFSDPELNKDKTKKGFFSAKGRVRAVKLRSSPSEGYIVPLNDILNWLCIKTGYEGYNAIVGTEFSHYKDILICEKYVVAQRSSGGLGKSSHGAVKQQSRLVDNQFRLHIDTANLKKEIHNVNPEDYISIGYKIHGTSCVVSRILCKKKLNLLYKIVKKIGVEVNDTHYDIVWSSRKVIKNSKYNNDKMMAHYYDSDIWGLAAKRLGPFIKEGVTLYSELTGYLPSGKMIQKDYDYSADNGNFDTWIYRITYTSLSGDVFEFSHHQIVKYCEKYGLKTVPYLYYGKAKDHFPELIVDENWHQNFLEKLKEKYCEKRCTMCKSDVPAEGVVLRKDQSDVFEVYKLKSFKFLEWESIELDKETIDIESEQSTV